MNLLLWVVMTYNVENFFWPGRGQWEKTERIGAVIAGDVRREAPVLVGLQEIGDDSAMVMLTRWELRKLPYDYIRRPSQDPRGIAVALMYDRERFCPLMDSTVGADLTARPLLYVRGLLDGRPMHVLVCHMPSQLGGARNQHKRHKLFERIELLCHRIQLQEPDPQILVMGDMNQELKRPLAGLEKAVVGPSYYVQHRWEQIDHILVSKALQQQLVRGWIDDRPWLLEENAKHVQGPFRTWQGRHYHYGYSDHLAGYAEFR